MAKETLSPQGPFDAAIIGGGHNGLVCAAYLALARKRVVVLEAGPDLGGMAALYANGARLFAPDVAFSAAVSSDLRLHKLGAKAAAAQPLPLALTDDGRAMALALVPPPKDFATPQLEPAAIGALLTRLREHAAALRPLIEAPAPSAGLQLRRPDDLARLATMSVTDLLEDTLETTQARAAMAVLAMRGMSAPPSRPGTALAWIVNLAFQGTPRQSVRIAGGAAALIEALRKAIETRGGLVRTGVRVARVTIDGDRATGVELATGERIAAAFVASSLPLEQTLLGLVGPRYLDIGQTAELRRRAEGGRTALMTFTLGRPLTLKARAEPFTAGALIAGAAPSAREHAYAAAAHGEFGPLSLEIHAETPLPPAPDTTPPPPRIGVIVHDVPQEPKEGWTAAKQVLTREAVRIIAAHAPDFPSLITNADVATPAGIASAAGSGYWHHGEPSLTRLLSPPPSSPIANLYLCGASMLPVGGISGLAGRAAAQGMLKAMKQGR